MSLLLVASWLLRGDSSTPPGTLALVCSFAGAAIALVTAWLGGELVSRLGVGVSDRAGLDAPNSLRREVAGASASAASRSTRRWDAVAHLSRGDPCERCHPYDGAGGALALHRTSP